MTKIKIGVTEEQESWLRKEATRRGLSISDVVRRIIDHARMPTPKQTDDIRVDVWQVNGPIEATKTLDPTTK